MQKLMKLTIAEALPGSAVDDSMPIGWLASFAQRVKRDAGDAQDVVVRGAAGIWAEWQHHLTPQEEAQARLDATLSRLERVRELIPRPGEPLSVEQVDALRKIVG